MNLIQKGSYPTANLWSTHNTESISLFAGKINCRRIITLESTIKVQSDFDESVSWSGKNK